MNLPNLPTADKAENFILPTLAALHVMRRFGLSHSLADTVCALSGLGVKHG